MLASSDAPLLALTLTCRSKEEEKEVDGIASDFEEVESTWKTIKAVLADEEKRPIREESVRLWLLELRKLAEEIEDLRDEFEYEVVAKEVEASSSCGDTGTSTRRELEEHVVEVRLSMITSLSPLLDAPFREQIAEGLARIKNTFESIARNKALLHLKVADSPPHDDNDGSFRSVPTGGLVTDPVFLGREQNLRQLRDSLIADHGERGCTENVEVIAVVGMGGMGKSTLAQHICEDLKIKGHFNEIIWVHVSQKFDEVRLTKAVVEHFPENCNFNELSTLQGVAKQSLKDKRVLLVMDDVWDTGRWESFLAPFRDGPIKGSKILVTTRLHEVADRTKAVETIGLTRLSEEDGWSLLKQHAFRNRSGDVNNIEELEEIGREIAVKCGGVPLSLKLLGGLLSDKKDDGEVWRSVLKSNLLGLSNLLDPSGGSDAGMKILGSLYLSYLHLSPKLRSCFKCCSRYPNGHMLAERLKQSWVAYEIVKDKTEATICLDALVSRSFLQLSPSYDLVKIHVYRGYGDEVSMHDHIYDLAQYVLEEKIQEKKYRNGYPVELNEDNFSGAQHVFISFLNEFAINKSLDYYSINTPRNLRTFELLFMGQMRLHLSLGQYLRELNFLTVEYNISNVHNILAGLKYLRIARIACEAIPVWVFQSYSLRYLEMHCIKLECLPDSVCNLRNLRGLILNNYKLRNLPEAISRLANLQELHLKYSGITCLPESISKLVNLQELNLKGCLWLRELPQGIVNLANLHILDLERTNVSSVPKGIGALIKLTILSQYAIDSEKAGLEELKNMRHLEDARIFNLHKMVNEEDASQAEMGNKGHLRRLLLCWYDSNVRDYRSIFDTAYIDDYDKVILYGEKTWCRMPRELRHQVQRRNDNEIARRDERTLERLRPHQNLEQVFICGYRGYELTSWMGNRSFSMLYKIVLGDISCCTSLSPIDGLPSLEVLVLARMATLQELVPNTLQSTTTPQQPFPKLRSLYIHHCDSIEFLPLCKFPSLQYVRVHGCSNLKHMEPPYHVPCLLNRIYIDGCRKFKFSPDPQSPAGTWCLSINERACLEDLYFSLHRPSLQPYLESDRDTQTKHDRCG